SAGLSTGADPWRAGHDAAERAISGGEPSLLMVFCSAVRDPRAVLTGINDASGRVPLIGCSSSAVIAPDGPSDDGVVVVALGGPGLSAAAGVARGVAGRQRAAGAEVALSSLDVPDRPPRVLILLTDGLAGGQEEILAGAYSVVGASMPLVGGTSSPEATRRRTFQLFGDEVLTDGAVGATITSEGPFGVGIRHGW